MNRREHHNKADTKEGPKKYGDTSSSVDLRPFAPSTVDRRALKTLSPFFPPHSLANTSNKNFSKRTRNSKTTTKRRRV